MGYPKQCSFKTSTWPWPLPRNGTETMSWHVKSPDSWWWPPRQPSTAAQMEVPSPAFCGRYTLLASISIYPSYDLSIQQVRVNSSSVEAKLYYQMGDRIVIQSRTVPATQWPNESYSRRRIGWVKYSKLLSPVILSCWRERARIMKSWRANKHTSAAFGLLPVNESMLIFSVGVSKLVYNARFRAKQ